MSSLDDLHPNPARFRLLFRNCPIMVIIIDEDLRILAANPSCETQLGYSIAELEGKSLQMVFDEEDRAAVGNELRLCLASPDKVHRWRFRKVRKDGVRIWVEELVQVMPGPKGEIEILVVCQDQTQVKLANDEIERLNAELVARAAELEARNEELDAFNHTVAHDLRQPLNALSSYCQVIDEICGNQLTDDCSKMIREAYNITKRMDELIGTLLQFSTIDTVKYNREIVDLSRQAQEVAQTLKMHEPERQIDFLIPEGILGYCDKKLVRIVLANLIGNAWKYTRMRRQAKVEFGTIEIAGVTTYFIRDNGVGFDTADAQKLFTPFLRLQGDKSRGFGIGLATVERIIRRHGGKIWGEGLLEQWACFYFTLHHEDEG